MSGILPVHPLLLRADIVLIDYAGEISAAFIAGYITAEEAIAIAYYRGIAVSKTAVQGAMMAVGLNAETVNQYISECGLQQQLCVACINSPSSTTVSGESDAVEKLLLVLQERGIFVRGLKTDSKAYHSHLMKTVGETYELLLKPIFLKRNSDDLPGVRAKMFSSVTAQPASKKVVGTAAYWRSNLESPVLFQGAMHRLLESAPFRLIEVGPHPALGQPVHEIQRNLSITPASYLPTLTRGKSGEISLLALAGNLYLHGHNLFFSNINNPHSVSVKRSATEAGDDSGCNGYCAMPKETAPLNATIKPRVLHDLPTYAWHYEDALWNESRTSSEYRLSKHKRHDLLGSRIPGSPGQAKWWRNFLKVHELPWLQDHKLGQSIVFPAAGYIAMAVEGILQLHEYPLEGVLTLREVHLLNVLVLQPEKEGVEISLQLDKAEVSSVSSSSIWWRFEISSHTSDTLTVHVKGLIAVKSASAALSSILPISPSVLEQSATRTWYNKLEQEGLSFGPEFRSLIEISTDRNQKLPYATSRTLFRKEGPNYLIHPITIDSMFQTAIIASASGAVQNLRGKVPTVIGHLDLSLDSSTHLSETCTIRAESKKVGFEAVVAGGELENSSGDIIAQMQGLRAISYTESSLQAGSRMERNPALRILWKPAVLNIAEKDTKALTKYLDHFISSLPKDLARSDLAYLAGAVDFITHQKSRLRILELNDEFCDGMESLLDLIAVDDSRVGFETYKRAMMTHDGEISAKGRSGEATFSKKLSKTESPNSNSIFDVVLIPSVMSPFFLRLAATLTDLQQDLARAVLDKRLDDLAKYLAPNALLIFNSKSSADRSLDGRHFSWISAVPPGSDIAVTIARTSHGSKREIRPNAPRIILVGPSFWSHH